MEENPLFNHVSEPLSSYYSRNEGLNLLLEKRTELLDLCLKHQIEKLYVFGSALGNTFSKNSDFDFLIRFKNIPFDQYTDHYFELHEDLERLLGRKIDLLTENSLRNKFLREKILSSRLLLYAA